MTTQRYTGGCQCGAVRYEAADIDLETAIACNCSRCGRLGLVLTFVPAEAFELKSGKDSLTEYQFNKHVIHHLFCKICGVQSFSRGSKPDGTEMVAVNVRCLDGISAHDLNPRKIDGRSR
jgi:hypothetical protein